MSQTDQFDQIHDRRGTAEKYDLRQQLFGSEDLTPMWVADTDFVAPYCVQQALSNRVTHPLYGYQEARPSPTIEAIQWWLDRVHQLIVAEEEVLLSPSVVTSMGCAIDAFTSEGGGVGFMTPIYPPFFKMPTYHNRKPVAIPLKREVQRYHIDFELLAQQLPNIELLMFCHPHNPSGRVWSVEELQQVLAMCRAAGVIVFSDEIHSDLVHASNIHTPLLSLPSAQECVVMAHSIGKTFNCAGLRASFMVIPDENLRKRFFRSQKKTHVDEISCMGKVALAAALSQEGYAYRSALLAYLAENIAATVKALNTVPDVEIMIPDATFLVWADLSGLPVSEVDLKRLLIDQAKVGFSAGESFGEPGRGYYRINVGLQRARLDEALLRVTRVLSQL